MKKILAIFLALVTIMSVALVACDKNNGGTTGGNSNDDDDDDIFVTQGNGKDTSDTDDTSDTKDTGDGWVEIATTVYAVCNFDLRKEADMELNGVKKIECGTALNAVAKNTAWYKVNYEGQELYIHSDYVGSSKAAATFTDLAEDDQFDIKIQAANGNSKPTINIRKIPTYDSKWGSYGYQTKQEGYIGTDYVLSIGITDTASSPLKVIAKNGTGDWYKVKYKGEEWYLPVTSATKPYLGGISTSPTPGGDDGKIYA